MIVATTPSPVHALLLFIPAFCLGFSPPFARRFWSSVAYSCRVLPALIEPRYLPRHGGLTGLVGWEPISHNSINPSIHPSIHPSEEISRKKSTNHNQSPTIPPSPSCPIPCTYSINQPIGINQSINQSIANDSALPILSNTTYQYNSILLSYD